MNTGEILQGIWTRLNGAPRRQVIVSTVEMGGPPNSVEVQDDDGRWIECKIDAVVGADGVAIEEMKAQGDVPIAADAEVLHEERAQVFGGGYVSVPIDAWGDENPSTRREAQADEGRLADE